MRDFRSASELKKAIAKLRVYTISDQDDSGRWLRKEFPDLFYIVSPSSPNGNNGYARATWTGISGDRFYKNGPGYHLDLVRNPWLKANIISRGPLGALYPPLKFIMEGDTPSFLGLIDNGLGWAVSPSYGGWGGRYALDTPLGEHRPIWTNNNDGTRDTVRIAADKFETSDFATIWRWREHFQHDFAAHMLWSVTDKYEKANHNPIAVLNGDRSKKVLHVKAKGGSTITLSAAGTSDPDKNAVKISWWAYPEAGTLGATVRFSSPRRMATKLHVPNVTDAGTAHIIMQVEDDGSPPLWSYRRMVIEVTP